MSTHRSAEVDWAALHKPPTCPLLQNADYLEQGTPHHRQALLSKSPTASRQVMSLLLSLDVIRLGTVSPHCIQFDHRSEQVDWALRHDYALLQKSLIKAQKLTAATLRRRVTSILVTSPRACPFFHIFSLNSKASKALQSNWPL